MNKIAIPLALFCFAFCTKQTNQKISEHFFGPPVSTGELTNPLTDEISGLAASRKYPGMFWAHNDSGDKARLFLLDTTAQVRLVVWLKGARNRDWEDIAVGPGPDASKTYVYVADIGDNQAVYKEKVIYRFAEPDWKENEITITDFDSVAFVYPDGRRDAETLLIDPLTFSLFVLSKREKQLHLYRLTWPPNTASVVEAELLADNLAFNSMAEPKGYHPLYYSQVTGGDVSPDGTEILIKDYSTVYYWKRKPGQTIAEVLQTTPYLLPYTPEPRGEAIAFTVTGSGFYTLSERADGKNPQLWFYPRHKQATQP
jgi:hypothetical protein